MVHWHSVGALDELPINELVPKTVGGIQLVLVRTAEGVIALRDRCPHRFAPLSLGKVVEGVVQCPYHGLRFGADGRCVFNPHGDGSIPAQARVAAYPVEQRGAEVFVGMEEEGTGA